ncbi:MAG: hypothetical protein Q8S75_09715, partial [Nitrospirota bacterium]|nr:hypothetical protein [Nitrospirota bacterium]
MKPTWRTPHLISRLGFAAALVVTMVAVGQLLHVAGGGQARFQRMPTQFIAALGDPGATSGSG